MLLQNLLKFRFSTSAEAGGFEPPVRLPVRQFSKLLVSATHPNFQSSAYGNRTRVSAVRGPRPRPLDESAMFQEPKRKLGDSNPRYGYPYGSLANCWFQPLTQTSKTSVSSCVFSQTRCKYRGTFRDVQTFRKLFLIAFINTRNTNLIIKRLMFLSAKFSLQYL